MRCKSVATCVRGIVVVVVISHLWAATMAVACTTAVISGKATVDGRPILWKNRDTRATRHNEVALSKGRYKAIAVVNAGQRGSVWMGVNEAGFCIENSLSNDLRNSEKTRGPGNGSLMKVALRKCASVEDFKKLLDETNDTGRSTVANFGVIDAEGGAALFETGPTSYVMFDANDPEVAPHGYIVRSNFSMTARDLPANPAAEQLDSIYSSERYLRARALLRQRQSEGVTVDYVLRNLTRDLADEKGRPFPGTVNGDGAALPPAISTASTISRTTTVSVTVFHGVRPDEDPALTTMWTILGDPKFSLAVPCWVAATEIADPLADEHGGELGEIAVTLRDWNLTFERDGVATQRLPGIWQDLWAVEDQILADTADAKERWSRHGFTAGEITELHRKIADTAMTAMQKELQEVKEEGLVARATSTLRADDAAPATSTEALRVAIYDHSDNTATGPKNLMRFLTACEGFECSRVSPADIRNGTLDTFHVLIMPGGSGSKQSQELQKEGRGAIRNFVQDGGGYVGICAGSYLASSQYSWSLGLINARVWDRAHWARGNGTVSIRLTSPGCEVLERCTATVDVRYAQGPLLVPDDRPELPAYQVLATYQTEIARKGAPEGAMVGTHAIVRSKFGKGRVICFSPHPEVKGGPNRLMSAGVRWAASGNRHPGHRHP